MKLKKTILGLAVVAVAGVNAWLANDANTIDFSKSLTLENIADATYCNEVVQGHKVEYLWQGESVTIVTYTTPDGNGQIYPEYTYQCNALVEGNCKVTYMGVILCNLANGGGDPEIK